MPIHLKQKKQTESKISQGVGRRDSMLQLESCDRWHCFHYSFYFSKKPLLLHCFSCCLLCQGEFWRSFFTCLWFECILGCAHQDTSSGKPGVTGQVETLMRIKTPNKSYKIPQNAVTLLMWLFFKIFYSSKSHPTKTALSFPDFCQKG